jgi:alpha-beta hydrolase superfamily lysophospholipase
MRRRPLLRIIFIIIILVALGALVHRARVNRENNNNPASPSVAVNRESSLRAIIQKIVDFVSPGSTPVPTPTPTPPTPNTPGTPATFQAGLFKTQMTYANASGQNITRGIEVWYPVSSGAKTYNYSQRGIGEIALNGQAVSGTFPLIVFSHGYRGCAEQSVFITEELARKGYIVAAVSHSDALCASGGTPTDGDDPVFRNANTWTDKNFIDRKEDISALITYMVSANGNSSSTFYNKINTEKIFGMGHSLGGYTILGMIGGWQSWTDNRLKGALLLSPFSTPFLDSDGNLAGIKVPTMFQGATLDLGITPSLPSVYAKVPSAKYFLVLSKSSHFVWTNFSCINVLASNCAKSGNPAVIMKYNLAFLNTYAKNDSSQTATLRSTDTSVSSYKYQE